MRPAMPGTADIFDAYPRTMQVCDLQFRSFGRIGAFCGPCTTVSVVEDHRPVLAVLDTPGEGRVLVVDGKGSLRAGLCGDRLAGIAVARGWAGLVLNGAIRDSAGIDGLAIGVKALGTTARRSAEARPSLAHEPVSFGGVTFVPGQWVYADRDAVLTGPAVPLPLPGA